MSVTAVIRMKYGDVMPYSPAVENNPMFCKISAGLAKAIADGKVDIKAAMDMYQRGGNPENLLLDGAVSHAEEKPHAEEKKRGRPKAEKESDPFKATGAGDLSLGA